MDGRKQTDGNGAGRGLLRLVRRRLACLLATTSLLPVLLLGPLGPGIVVIHDHHEADLHAHKVHPVFGGQSAASDGHDHSDGTAVDLEAASFVLTLPDMPPRAARVKASTLQVKFSQASAVAADILSQDTTLSAVDFGARRQPVAALRAGDMIARLLMGGHSLLI